MSATFTPGPWSLALPDYDEAQAAYHDGVEPDQASVSGGGWRGLATVYVVVGGQRDEAGEANARLVSAAPDLLAACQLILSMWDRMGLKCAAGDGSAIGTVMAAIAKAVQP